MHINRPVSQYYISIQSTKCRNILKINSINLQSYFESHFSWKLSTETRICRLFYQCAVCRFIWEQLLSSSWDERPFGHNRHGPRIADCVPLGSGGGFHLTQCGQGRGLPPYQVASWSIQPFGHNRRGPTIGGCVHLAGRYRPRPWPHGVRWGPSSPSTKGHSPQFSVHVYCGQTVAHLSHCCMSSCFLSLYLHYTCYYCLLPCFPNFCSYS